MCGRVILTLSAKMIEQLLSEEYDIHDLSIDDFAPRYNVGPSQEMLSVIANKGTYRSGYLNWRYLPSYAKKASEGYRYINARSETVHEKITFKEAFQRRRCLLICNGFYEWKRTTIKRPFLFHRPDFGLIVMAGLWQPQYLEDGTKEYGLSILTTEANNLMKPIHHRMPVILKKDEAKNWLNPTSSLLELQRLFHPIADDYLNYYEVSTKVNSLSFQESTCIQAVTSLR